MRPAQRRRLHRTVPSKLSSIGPWSGAGVDVHLSVVNSGASRHPCRRRLNWPSLATRPKRQRRNQSRSRAHCLHIRRSQRPRTPRRQRPHRPPPRTWHSHWSRRVPLLYGTPRIETCALLVLTTVAMTDHRCHLCAAPSATRRQARTTDWSTASGARTSSRSAPPPCDEAQPSSNHRRPRALGPPDTLARSFTRLSDTGTVARTSWRAYLSRDIFNPAACACSRHRRPPHRDRAQCEPAAERDAGQCSRGMGRLRTE